MTYFRFVAIALLILLLGFIDGVNAQIFNFGPDTEVDIESMEVVNEGWEKIEIKENKTIIIVINENFLLQCRFLSINDEYIEVARNLDSRFEKLALSKFLDNAIGVENNDTKPENKKELEMIVEDTPIREGMKIGIGRDNISCIVLGDKVIYKNKTLEEILERIDSLHEEYLKKMFKDIGLPGIPIEDLELPDWSTSND